MKVWKLVKELEEGKEGKDMQVLAEIKATLLVNYGEEGRIIKGLINQYQSPTSMIVTVLTVLHEKLNGGNDNAE